MASPWPLSTSIGPSPTDLFTPLESVDLLAAFFTVGPLCLGGTSPESVHGWPLLTVIEWFLMYLLSVSVKQGSLLKKKSLQLHLEASLRPWKRPTKQLDPKESSLLALCDYRLSASHHTYDVPGTCNDLKWSLKHFHFLHCLLTPK